MKTRIRAAIPLPSSLARILASGILVAAVSAPRPAAASGPWNGHAVAFTFSSDDGNRPDNLAWAGVFAARGLSYTLFIPSAWIGSTTQGKLTTDDLRSLEVEGIEIGSHGKTHVRLTDIDGARLLDELVGSRAELEAAIGGDYRCLTLAYPEHAHDLHVMAVVESLGFVAARDGGFVLEGYPNFSLGGSTWKNVGLFELPLSAVDSFLVGPGNSHTETETRTRVRQLVTGKAAAQFAWINIYAHTLNDIDVPHMMWVLDELQANDVWVAGVAEIAGWYRGVHALPDTTGGGPGWTGIGPGDSGKGITGRVFPNPFRQAGAVIRFTVPGPGAVTVRILDPTGRVVRSLAGNAAAAGERSIRWDGRDEEGRCVPPGTYVYEVRSDGSVTAGKMIRLR